uniref:Uncharacterized protein n=1 Tax=Rhizophora mucronata TaxID=61149 RepID=A0A2P2QA89_RHIMU
MDLPLLKEKKNLKNEMLSNV